MGNEMTKNMWMRPGSFLLFSFFSSNTEMKKCKDFIPRYISFFILWWHPSSFSWVRRKVNRKTGSSINDSRAAFVSSEQYLVPWGGQVTNNRTFFADDEHDRVVEEEG